MTPRTLTDFSNLSVVFSSNFNSVSSAEFGDNVIEWNLLGFASIPLMLNQSTAILRSMTEFARRFAASITNKTLNSHRHNYRGYIFQGTGIGQQWTYKRTCALILSLVVNLWLIPPMSFARFLFLLRQSTRSSKADQSTHHKHRVSQSINCGRNSRKLSTDP